MAAAILDLGHVGSVGQLPPRNHSIPSTRKHMICIWNFVSMWYTSHAMRFFILAAMAAAILDLGHVGSVGQLPPRNHSIPSTRKHMTSF
jgi:hypothetical protein